MKSGRSTWLFGVLLVWSIDLAGGAALRGQTKPAVPAQPVVDAGTVVGDFARDYDKAMEKYEIGNITLAGRVEKINIRKATDGHTLVTVNIVPRDPGASMIPIFVDFSATMVPQVSKLKPGDLVLIDASYLPVPAAAPIIHEIRGFLGEKIGSLGADQKLGNLKTEAMSWVRKSNSLSPGLNNSDNQLEKNMDTKISASISAGDDFSILFGSGLMKSGKAAILSVQDGKLFTNDLTQGQAAALGISEMSAVHTTTHSSALRMAAEVQTPSLVLDNNTAWNLSKPFMGKVTTRELIRHDDRPADYGLRMVCYSGKRVVFFSSFRSLPGNATHPFSFRALSNEIADLDLGKGPMPRMVYFEVVRRTGGDPMGDPDKAQPIYEVISEPVGFLLTLSER